MCVSVEIMRNAAGMQYRVQCFMKKRTSNGKMTMTGTSEDVQNNQVLKREEAKETKGDGGRGKTNNGRGGKRRALMMVTNNEAW